MEYVYLVGAHSDFNIQHNIIIVVLVSIHMRQLDYIALSKDTSFFFPCLSKDTSTLLAVTTIITREKMN